MDLELIECPSCLLSNIGRNIIKKSKKRSK